MYNLLKKGLITVSDIEQIFSPQYKHPRQKEMFVTYIRLRIKASFNRWFHFKREHFLSYQVEFPDYEIFFSTFRQVFVRHAYYVDCSATEPVIVDCGGNIGMSVLYFKYLYPKAHITVFEPSREVLPSIRKNIALNTPDVTLIEKAVSDTDGTATMHSRGAAACGNTLTIGVGLQAEKSSGEKYEVPTVRLSPFIPEVVDILKLDIEGSEGGVLREIEKAGALTRIRAVVMEYHEMPHSKENQLSEIISILEKNDWLVEPFSEDIHTTYSLSLRTKAKKTTGN